MFLEPFPFLSQLRGYVVPSSILLRAATEPSARTNAARAGGEMAVVGQLPSMGGGGGLDDSQ